MSPKKYYKKIIIQPLIFLILLLSGSAYAQTVVNNGADIVIREGAYMVIGGNYINKNDGTGDGQINIDGNIILKRNWVNFANNKVLINVGAGPTGNVIMNGSIKQYIEGTHESIFENIVLRNSIKSLRQVGCEVNDTLNLGSVLELNRERIKILNQTPAGIQYISGYILSETNSLEGYGEVEWKIGSHADSLYSVPFGSGYSLYNDLNVRLRTNSMGFPATGSIIFSTYPTGCQNVPIPIEVMSLDRSFEYIADRYWIINPVYDQKPCVDIELYYTNQDINEACNGGILESELKAIRYNTLMNTWADLAPTGSSTPDQNRFLINDLPPDDFYAPWALVSEVIDWVIYFPNTFTPNEDGINDFFGPIGNNLDKCKLTMYVFNRWGNELCKLEGGNISWDGTYNDKICQDGVYTWILFLTDPEGMEHKYLGHVTILN